VAQGVDLVVTAYAGISEGVQVVGDGQQGEYPAGGGVAADLLPVCFVVVFFYGCEDLLLQGRGFRQGAEEPFDNAAMIAGVAYEKVRLGRAGAEPGDVNPNLRLSDWE